MDLGYFERGLIIGLSVAAPVGPMSVLVMQRTLSQGRLRGLTAGLGVATADAIYGSVAAFGLSAVVSVLVAWQVWLRLFGGLFLIWLGLQTFRTPLTAQVSTPEAAATTAPLAAAGVTGTPRIFLTMLLLTLTNPATILSFAAIFAGFGIGETGGQPLVAVAIVLGVLAGSALWWVVLTSAIGWARQMLAPRVMHWINRVAGLVIGLAGLVALLSLIKP